MFVFQRALNPLNKSPFPQLPTRGEGRYALSRAVFESTWKTSRPIPMSGFDYDRFASADRGVGRYEVSETAQISETVPISEPAQKRGRAVRSF